MAHKSDRHNRNDEPVHSFWISFSDLMANLIFIFLLVIAIFSLQFKKEQSAFVVAKEELQSPAKTRAQILKDLQGILRDSGLEVETIPEDGILRLSEKTLSFPPARAFPEAEKLSSLGLVAKALSSVLACYSKTPKRPSTPVGESGPEQAEWCQAVPTSEPYECNTQYRGSIETVMIEGHTDATTVRATAGYLDNLALSAARATTVMRLVKHCSPQLGMMLNKKQQPILGVSGYSDLRPVLPEAPKDPRNRRIDIRLMMDLPDNALDSEPRRTSKTRAHEAAL